LSFAAQVLADHAGVPRYEVAASILPQWHSIVYPQLIASNSLDASLAWAEVAVPLRLARGELRLLLLGRRRGGRRYLSEDLHDLSHLASAAAEQLERFRSDRVQQLAAKAELRALQAQINPHFLFNSLNALYGAIPRSAEAARRTVLNLADIFRYVLQSERQQIALSEEVRIVKAYLEIEQLRLGERLQVDVDVDPAALGVIIPSLSIQPLVENAVKHGVAARSGPGHVAVRVRRRPTSVEVAVEDSGGRFPAASEDGAGTGVGLENVRQRLRLMYGPGATVQIESDENRTAVSFAVPLLQTTGKERADAYADR
jgi:two-component system sensor histidine kinase LytS